MRTAKSLLHPRHALAVAAVVLAVGVVAPAAQAAPKRIVALTPFAANTLVNLGVKPAAIGETLGGKERFSPKLRGVKTLTLSHPNGPNLEELAVLDPQLVLTSPTWRKGTKTMRDLDIKVVETDPRTVSDTYSLTRTIGKLVGRKKTAAKLEAKLRRQVKDARKGIRKHPKVLLILGVGRTPFVMLPNSWGGDLVRKAGGKLITAGIRNDSGFARISDERILTERPEVIIAIPHANSDDIPKVKKFLESNPAWEGSPALENDRIYVPTDNSLLQAGTDVARIIRKVRRSYLHN